MSQATCRSCGAPIIWARTEKGKPIPMNAEPVEVTPRGLFHLEVETPEVTRAYPFSARGYVSHFATCPQADQWRKEKERQDMFNRSGAFDH